MRCPCAVGGGGQWQCYRLLVLPEDGIVAFVVGCQEVRISEGC